MEGLSPEARTKLEEQTNMRHVNCIGASLPEAFQVALRCPRLGVSGDSPQGSRTGLPFLSKQISNAFVKVGERP